MTQEEKWLARYKEVMEFIEVNKRNPSKYDDEERGKYCNWIKHNRQLLNKCELKPERVKQFSLLLTIIEQNRNINQYV